MFSASIVRWSMAMQSPVSAPLSPGCGIAADPSNKSAHPGEEALPLLRPLPTLPQSLAGTVEDQVEALRLDPQVGADLLLAGLREVEADEHLPVALEAEPGEDLLHLPRLLVGRGAVERGRAAVGERDRRARPLLLPLAEVGVARLLAPVGDEQVARRAADETGEPRGLAHLAAADLLDHQGEGLLV